MPRTGFHPRSLARPLRRLALPLLAALALSPVADPAAAEPDDGGELDALVQSTLDGVPVARAEEAVAWILEAYQGTTHYHAVSPGSLFQSGDPIQHQVLGTASGSLRFEGPLPYCAYAPIHLPQGATVTGLVFWVRDNNGADDSTAKLYRRSVNGTTGTQELASASSSGASGGARIFADFTVSNGLVDNLGYWYFVWVCLPNYGAPDGPTEMRGLYLAYVS